MNHSVSCMHLLITPITTNLTLHQNKKSNRKYTVGSRKAGQPFWNSAKKQNKTKKKQKKNSWTQTCVAVLVKLAAAAPVG